MSSIITNPVALALARENLKLGENKLQLLFSTAMSEKLTLYKGANAIENVHLISPNIPKSSIYTNRAQSRWGQSQLDWRVATSYNAAQALLLAVESSENPTRMEILHNLNNLELSVDRTSGCGFQCSPDHSNSRMEYRIDQIVIQ